MHKAESLHCIRQSRNFRNPSLTLAKHHQIFQAYLLEVGLFGDKLQWTESSCDYSLEVLNVLTANAVTISNAILCKSATYKGTRYISGQYVVLGKGEFDFIVGKVLLVAVFWKRLYFVIKKMVASLQFRLGIYCFNANRSTIGMCRN